jgi:hypothetical protein
VNKRLFPALLVFGILGAALFPSPAFAQTAPVEGWGRDDQGRAMVAVLPLAGEEAAMIRRFYGGIIDAVNALGKYSPREVSSSAVVRAEVEIPTDMPPVPGLTAGARYALTGGVYLGNRTGEYYLQLWLWDMAGSTMIYTDDLVYSNMDNAMRSLPGLVEWLFSHIRELTLEEPEDDAKSDPLFMFGFRAGPSPRWYVNPGERSAGASALTGEGGISGALRLNSLFSLQLEVLLSGDILVYRGLNIINNEYVLVNKKFTALSLSFPILLKMNFKAGPVRLSPLAGLYLMAPLGRTRYRLSIGRTSDTYSWSFSVPLGFTAGLEGALRYGPGRLFAGARYAVDFGYLSINNGTATEAAIRARRHMVSIYLGYEFGFFNGKKLGDRL